MAQTPTPANNPATAKTSTTDGGLKLVGQDYTTPDLVAKVTGKAKYAEDWKAEGMLFAKLLLSPMPHARVTNLDVSAALAMPGVKAILTADDLPGAQAGATLGENVVSAAQGERPLTMEPVYEGEPILAVAAIDLGGRPHAVVDLQVKVPRVGDLQTELVHDFFEGFAIGARANVHVKVLYGRLSHHKIEAVFKAFARALRVACAKDKRLAKMLPSTKGLL